MAVHFTGPMTVTNGLNVATGSIQQGGTTPGAAGSLVRKISKAAAIADSVATTVATLTIPNANASATLRVLVRSTLTGANAYQSTRTAEYLITIARTAGANAAGAISAAIGAQIATVAGGATLTTALSLAAVAGAVGSPNTIAIQVTNVGSVAQISETELIVELLNGAAGGVTVA